MQEYIVDVNVEYTAAVRVKASSPMAAEAIAYELDVAGYTQEGIEASGAIDGDGSNPLDFMVDLEFPHFIRETSPAVEVEK